MFVQGAVFTEHTVESAPPSARRAMTATASRLGYLPSAIARMAASPDLLDGFLTLSAMFERTTLDPIARETLIMTMAARNGCQLCQAMHTARLTALDADAALIAALRSGEPLADPRLDAIRVFTLLVLDTAGDVGEAALQSFLAQGYTARNALEVVLGIGAYTTSTLANRLTGAPVDEPLRQFA
jgi:AhpD family alkylhydroperoxidase